MRLQIEERLVSQEERVLELTLANTNEFELRDAWEEALTLEGEISQMVVDHRHMPRRIGSVMAELACLHQRAGLLAMAAA